MNSIDNHSININFESNLCSALDNEDKLGTIKGEVKGRLEDKSLTLDQRRFFLNTITLINEILINKQSDKYKEKPQLRSEQLLSEMLESAKLSSHVISLVILNNPAGRQDQFQKATEETAAKIATLQKEYGEKTYQDLLSLVTDVALYGTMSLSQREDEVEALNAELSGKYPGISMLINTGDGSCLYNALSTADTITSGAFKKDAPIKESEKEASQKRTLAVEYMRENHFKKDECDNHAKETTWGEDTQIHALAVKEDKPILVLRRYKGETIGKLYSKDGFPANPKELRVIVNINNQHYNALYTTDDNREDLARHYYNNIVPVS